LKRNKKTRYPVIVVNRYHVTSGEASKLAQGVLQAGRRKSRKHPTK